MLRQLRQCKGQLAGWEALIILILMVSIGALGWMIFKKDSSIYQSGSNPVISDNKRIDWPLSIHVGEGGCARNPSPIAGVKP